MQAPFLDECEPLYFDVRYGNLHARHMIVPELLHTEDRATTLPLIADHSTHNDLYPVRL